MKHIYTLKNPIQEYAWGSRTAIPELLGEPSPSEKPQAELWMGAHPKSSSQVNIDGNWVSLTEWIPNHAEAILGKSVSQKFSGQLPFLFKVLAAARPLSIQAHPNRLQAQEGFDRENALCMPLNSPLRNYRDRHHKPEIICALTPFSVLCGFRPIPAILSLMQDACGSTLKDELDEFRDHPERAGLKIFFHRIMTLPVEKRNKVIDEALHWAQQLPDNSESILKWMIRLSSEYPDDIGVLSPLLLNGMVLTPGQAIYLPAGELHAYIDGTGIELMANSDNVIRGGLTPKHVDVEELIQILTFHDRWIEPVRTTSLDASEQAYLTDAEEFRLSVIKLNASTVYDHAVSSVEILLCVEGQAKLTSPGHTVAIRKGLSFLVPAFVESYQIRGNALIYKASVPMNENS